MDAAVCRAEVCYPFGREHGTHRAVKRREFITLLGGAAACPLAARAQAPRHIPRLCFLTFDPGTLQSNRFDAFFQGLRDLGYANGQNIAIDYRYS